MRGEEIRSTKLLRVGWIDFGTRAGRRGVDRCPEEFPALEVRSEASLVAAWRKEGVLPEHLLQWGSDFSRFRPIRDLHLLFLVFEEGPKRYLRAVNFLSRSVSTVVLDVASPRCEELLRKERLVGIDSHPPIADVSVDGRVVGEAPIWISLRKGSYEISCALSGETFKPMEISIPGVVKVLCQRENTDSRSSLERDDDITSGEKAGSVLVYLLGAAASLAAVILPILFLF
jgi:hypothetical protein